MKLTPGKLAGLKKVSNERGVIAAAAMDQRGSLQKSLSKEKGGEISDAMMEEFKILVAEVLTPHASAILLDGNGVCRPRSGAPRMLGCSWLMRRRVTTRPDPAGLAICWIIGRRGG